MNRRRLAELEAKRGRLVAQAQAQREAVALEFTHLETPLALADRGIAAVRYVRDHPGVLFAAAAIVLIVKPRRALVWLRRGVLAWRGYRWAYAALARLAGPL